jgi:hypothetical protein
LSGKLAALQCHECCQRSQLRQASGAELELPDALIAATLKSHLGPPKIRNFFWANSTLLDIWLKEYQGVLVKTDIRASYRLNLPHVAAGGSVESASTCALL